MAAVATILLAGLSAVVADHAEMRSVGPMVFGEKGVLFVGDPMSATIFAIETEENGSVGAAEQISVEGINQQMAEIVGTEPGDIQVNDMAVNPETGSVYFSAMRGRGPDAIPMLFWIDASSEEGLEEFYLDDYEMTAAKLPNPPDENAPRGRRRNQRAEAITDLTFIDGRLFIAGLSNEEFASKLRSIPYPFSEAGPGTSVEIYHGAHGAYETRAPVRTFTPFEIEEEPHLLAAYTCTPLVKFPVEQLEPGKKIRGTTVAELGNRNRPLDMIVYQQEGKDFALIANSARGVMKLPLDEVAEVTAITERISGTAGLAYDTLDWEGVVQMDRWGKAQVAVLRDVGEGVLNLEIHDLP